jgi:large subunit ribosomal protein L10
LNVAQRPFAPEAFHSLWKAFYFNHLNLPRGGEKKMPNKQNIAALAELKELFSGATAIYVSHSKGLNVGEATALRANLRAVKVQHRVAKNTLVAIAAKELGFGEVAKYLTGPTQLTICKGDMLAAAKVLVDFAKKCEHFELVGGMIEGKDATKADIEVIASLPSREVLLTQLVGTLNSPITGMVRVLNGMPRSLVIALNGVAEKKAA